MKPVVRLPVHMPDFEHLADRRILRVHHAVMAHIAFASPPLYDPCMKEKTMNPLTLHPVNDQVVRVLSSQGECVGHLKLIGAVWKFKAIGYDASCAVIPGGGPLTDRHNTRFAVLDEAVVNAALTGF